MLQEVFRIGSFPIYGYGLMMVIGFLAAVQVAKYLSRRSRIDPELFVNAALLALIAGVVGARASDVLENLSDFTRSDLSVWQNFYNMINIRSGGLTFFGGLILAFPVVLIYGWLKKVPLRRGMDVAAPCIMIGLAFGRIGCFLNGCCYGAECQLPWAVHFPYQSIAYVDEVYNNEIRPPAQLMIRDGNSERLISKDELRRGCAEHLVRGVDGQWESQRIPLDASVVALAARQHSRWVQPTELYSSFNAFLIAAVLIAFFSLSPAPGA